MSKNPIEISEEVLKYKRQIRDFFNKYTFDPVILRIVAWVIGYTHSTITAKEKEHDLHSIGGGYDNHSNSHQHQVH